jgi:3-(3-hydroxy-phenyl)propionate hydroxylase
MPDGDVLIVGGGPVGLVMAARMRQLGISVILCEAEREFSEDLRASTFHPPTLDMLATLGFADPLIGEGLVSPTWQVRMHETGEKAEFDVGLLKGETDHPYRLQCEQFRLCRIAATRLVADGADIRMGARAVSASDDGDCVRTTLEGADGVQSLSTRYLVGADGARSFVRSLIDPEFGGRTYPETTILATTEFPFEEHISGLSNVNYIWWSGGTFSLLRLRHLWRCSLYPDEGESIEDALAPYSIERKLQRIHPRPERYETGEVRSYRVHMRIAGAYRRGRALLAGDAAHLNSPSGGMGMNGGIHDAFALSVAVRRALDGEDAALDRYATVRRRIAEEDILAQADRNRARMQERDPERRRELFLALQRTASDTALAKAHLLKTSMIEGLRRAEAML